MSQSSPSNVLSAHDICVKLTTDLQGPWKPSLSDDDQKKLGVMCGSLDLDAAAANYVQPLPQKDMEKWLDETKPWICRGDGYSEESRPLWQADIRMNDLDAYASMGWKNPLGGGVRFQHTKWETESFLKRPWVEFAETQMGEFRIKYTYAYKDTSHVYPHVSALVAHSTPLEENELSSLELWCIAKLTIGRLRKYPKHRIPITMISAHAWKVRVLHAYYVDQKLHVYKSHVVNLDVSQAYKQADWRRLLCWMMAKPRADAKTLLE